MARSQHSWGLKFALASIVLLFCLAVTTVEGRSIPFIAHLTPENTGRTNSNNRNFVGQAFAYLAASGREFNVRVLAVSNIDTDDITKVQLFDLENAKLFGSKFELIKSGFYTFTSRLTLEVGARLNVEQIGLNIYTKKVGSSRPALSGVFVNNRTSFIAFLQSDQETTTPPGTLNNDGFASGIAWTTDSINYFMSVIINHDIQRPLGSIHLHAPAPSNTNGPVVINMPVTFNQASKVINFPINSTELYWFTNHLGYVNLHDAGNRGILRGQFIPMTTPRIRTPTFPNKVTTNIGGESFTFLPDGGVIEGNAALSLQAGGATELPGTRGNPRLAIFTPNRTTLAFNNRFRFELPVTIKNRYSLRAAVFYVTAAAAVEDNNKFQIGLLEVDTQNTDNFITVPGTGPRSFSTYQLNIDTDAFPTYLGPLGLLVNVQSTAISGRGLYVDRFFMTYYVVNAYANNIMKAMIIKGSSILTN